MNVFEKLEELRAGIRELEELVQTSFLELPKVAVLAELSRLVSQLNFLEIKLGGELALELEKVEQEVSNDL